MGDQGKVPQGVTGCAALAYFSFKGNIGNVGPLHFGKLLWKVFRHIFIVILWIFGVSRAGFGGNLEENRGGNLGARP